MKTRLLFLSALALWLAGCHTGRKAEHAEAAAPFAVKYAEGFTVRPYDGYTLVDVRDPWDTTRTLHRYVLVDRAAALPDELPEGTLVRVPLQRIVCYSSVHCGMLDDLDLVDRVAGVCEARFIDVPYIREGVARGTVADLGEASAPDVERIVLLAPEAIVAAPLENAGYGRVGKTGIPVIECVDYMESSPLGRAEWGRFLSLFLGNRAGADSLFAATEAAYDSLKRLAAGVPNRPSVVTEKKYGSAWYMPGGRSYAANLLRDAGADYPWKDDPSTGSVPLSFETVLEKAGTADFWLIKYNSDIPMTYGLLKREYDPYRRFRAFETHNVFVCNTGEKPYYEELPMHPDRVLKDLIGIFHPELLPGYRLRYYNRMTE